MIKFAGWLMIYTAITFGAVSLLDCGLCFKEKAKLFIGIETFLALLVIGVYIITS